MKKFGKKTVALVVAAVAALTIAGAAFAIVTFDPATGTGFVGKGDVQTVYAGQGIKANDQWLQTNALKVDFRAFGESSQDITWDCRNDEIGQNGQTQNKATTLTTTFQGLVTTVARDNSKGKNGPITGFYLRGYEGTPITTEEKAGPNPPVLNTESGLYEMQNGTCPANPSGWYLVQSSVVVGDPVPGDSGLQVTINGTNWFDIG